MIDDDNKDMQSLITFDRVMFANRRKLRLSQKEFVVELCDRNHEIDYVTYSKLENARIDIRFPEWDWLIPKLSRHFQIDLLWLQSIRQQTEVKTNLPDDSPAFITYARHPEI